MNDSSLIASRSSFVNADKPVMNALLTIDIALTILFVFTYTLISQRVFHSQECSGVLLMLLNSRSVCVLVGDEKSITRYLYKNNVLCKVFACVYLLEVGNFILF